MRNNSVLGSCDQAVRQAGGLVLELWGCTDRQGMGGGGGGREQGRGLLIQLTYDSTNRQST